MSQYKKHTEGIPLVFCVHGGESLDFIREALRPPFAASCSFVVFDPVDENVPVQQFCESARIQFVSKSINECRSELSDWSEGILVSLYCRQLIVEELISEFDGRAINYHPSILPRHTGCFSSSWEILQNDDWCGFTFHYMRKKVDSGNIIYQESFPMSQFYSAWDLFKIKKSLALSKIHSILRLVSKGHPGYPQSTDGRTFHKRAVPFDGLIDPTENNFEFAERMIRALQFPGKPPANLKLPDGRLVELTNREDLEKYRHYFR